MFEKMVSLPSEGGKSAIKAEISTLKAKLTVQQQQIKQAKLPVVVLLEGWGAAGKGSLLSDIILNIDPRSFNVFSINPPTDEESRRPFLWRYVQKIPEAGQFVFFDSGWYGETVQNRMDGALSGKAYRRRIQSINNFERQLSDNGYLVVKFFLHIPKKVQDERFEKLLSSKNTEWRISKADKRENRHYGEYAAAWDELMDRTDTPAVPWHVIDGSERVKWLQVYRVLTRAIDAALSSPRPACAPEEEAFPLLEMPLLKDVSLRREVAEDEYRARLKEAQSKLGDLHNRIYRRKIPVILAGGIRNHEDYVHAMELGVDGIQVASRFVTTVECDADEKYKNAYIQAKKEDIEIVKSPVGMPGRAIHNALMDKVASGTRVPAVKCLNCIHTCDPATTPYCITDALIHAAKGELSEALLFCGGRAYEADHIGTVKEVIDSYRFFED